MKLSCVFMNDSDGRIAISPQGTITITPPAV